MSRNCSAPLDSSLTGCYQVSHFRDRPRLASSAVQLVVFGDWLYGWPATELKAYRTAEAQIIPFVGAESSLTVSEPKQ